MIEISGADFVLKIVISLIAGVLIGSEREWRGKPAGIGTQSLVVGGAMLFTFLSFMIDPSSPARVAANIVVGIGFLGAGIILRGEHDHVTNVTTAASIWFSSAIGMAIGMGMYLIALIAVVYAVVVPLIPQVRRKNERFKK